MKFCLALFFLIFQKSTEIDNFSSKYVSAIGDILKHYDFKDIGIYCSQKLRFSKTFDLISQNISSNGKFIFSENKFIFSENKFQILNLNSNMFILIIESAENINFSEYFQKFKLIIIISSSKYLKLSEIRRNLIFHQILVFFDGQLLKFENFTKDGFSELDEFEVYRKTFDYMKSYKVDLYRKLRLDTYRLFPLMFINIAFQKTGKLEYFNLEFKEYINKKLNLSNTNITILKFMKTLDTVPNIEEAFPVIISNLCLLAPIVKLLPSKMFLISIFHWNLWISIIFGILIISICIRMFFPMDFFKSVYNSLGITFFSCTELELYTLNIKRIFLISSFWIYGYVILNNFNAKLYSILTNLNYGKQIETFQDVLDNSLKVLIPKTLNTTIPEGFEQFFMYKSLEFCFENIQYFNTSYSYMLFDYQWAMFDTSQRLLKRKRLRFTNYCVQDHLHFIVSMLVPSFHAQEFKYFTMKVQESGLLDIWNLYSYFDAEREFITFRDKEDVREPLDLKYFLVSWLILMIGCLLANVAFVYEVLRK